MGGLGALFFSTLLYSTLPSRGHTWWGLELRREEGKGAGRGGGLDGKRGGASESRGEGSCSGGGGDGSGAFYFERRNRRGGACIGLAFGLSEGVRVYVCVCVYECVYLCSLLVCVVITSQLWGCACSVDGGDQLGGVDL